jgi:hypothetical protein
MLQQRNSLSSYFKTIRLSLLFLTSLASANPTFSADISGQVLTTGSQPICALVLASGRNLFSCNQGQYSFVNLPLEPDGSINLQVYADGFLPYIKNIRQFGPQPPLVMLPSVDNGLSDMSLLQGVYALLRSSVVYDDGTTFDTTAAPGITVSGTFTFTGNRFSQTLTFNNNGQPSVFEANGTFVDLGYAVRLSQAGFLDSDVLLLNRGSKLSTMVDVPNYAEVDQWRKVAGTSAARALSIDEGKYLQSDGTAGGVTGAFLETYGLRQLMSKKITMP